MRPFAAWVAAILTLGGCSTISETAGKLNPFSPSAPKVKPAELATLQPTAEMRFLWQAGVGGAGEFVFTPAVVGDSVYAAARDGTVARFDGGRQVWRVSAGQILSGGVGSDGKRVAVGTLKGEVLVFSAETGALAWKARVTSEILAAPAMGDGLVVVRSGDSRIFGFEAADGKRRWVYQRSTPALSLRSQVGMTLSADGQAILAGFPGGKLVAISPKNGAALWEGTVALPRGATELERVADITSPPVMAGREICAVAFQGRVACFDLASGNALWARDLSSSAGLDLDGRHVFVSDDKGAIHAFDRGNGASLWKQDKLFMRGLSRPIVLGSHMAVADYQGVVHLLRGEDGAFAARLNTDGSAVLADPQRIPGGILVQTVKGGLFALAVN
ncbi:MAG: outer membrane protein assembly factor BamB [Candidatus Nitricoxidivorans perseverans]|uniref:Outer membrane protein assembly factor BamB n=1 Tax=Candidatus Nitricoxidivorans perseverans TaxID=2975601 RepID=A0AA49FNE8_9PROT|nr:MAG: outer membrane protein assembly factor BamB [Candidatus Nitricoxidivorans perseverans]